MTDEETARMMADEWRRSHDSLEGLVAHVEEYGGYWWASFRPPGAEHPNIGGTLLLIDVSRQAVTVASSSRPPNRRIADYEASLKDR